MNRQQERAKHKRLIARDALPKISVLLMQPVETLYIAAKATSVIQVRRNYFLSYEIAYFPISFPRTSRFQNGGGILENEETLERGFHSLSLV